MQTPMKLSILIPVYNEFQWLDLFWNRLKKAPVDKCAGVKSVEIILVDDGSSDGSREYLAELAQTPFHFHCGATAEVRFIAHEKNRGKGAAIQTAIRASTGDAVLIQDADLEYSPDDYPTLLTTLISQNADAVFGSRFMGQTRRVLLFWHMVGNRLFTLLSNMFSNLNLTDMECGYKLVRGDLARNLRLVSPRFGIEPELTARLARANAKIFEVPVSYAGRSYEDGKKIGFKDAVAALFHIFRFSLLDREPFVAGQTQTLHALDKSNHILYAPLIDKALHGLPLEQNSKILEIGSGTGGITKKLLQVGEVTASDIDENYLRICKEKFLGHRRFRGAQYYNAEKKCPFPDRTYDLAVAINLLEHIKDDHFALSEWARTLKPGGHLICLVPYHQKLYGPVDRAVGHFRRYNREQLTQKLEEAGLEVEKVFYGNPFGLAGWWLNNLSGKSTLSMVGVYSALKPWLRPLESRLENYIGLNLIVVAKLKKSPSLPDPVSWSRPRPEAEAPISARL